MTVALPALVAQIADWRVDTSIEVASDHRLLLTQVRGQPQRAVVRQRPNWRAVDWVTFSKQLQWELLSRASTTLCQSPQEIDSTVASLSEALDATIHCCVPIRRLCQYSCSWWTPELSQQWTQMTRLCRRWMQRGTVQTREDYL